MDAVKFDQVATDIQSIISLDFKCDWGPIHAMIVAYLEEEGCEPLTSIDQDITCFYLNAVIVRESDIREFLTIHCGAFKQIAA